MYLMIAQSGANINTFLIANTDPNNCNSFLISRRAEVHIKQIENVFRFLQNFCLISNKKLKKWLFVIVTTKCHFETVAKNYEQNVSRKNRENHSKFVIKKQQ